MDKLYETYKKYDWQNDKDWQNYFNNIYPVPSREKVEKIRRKWYKKNKEPTFDVEYKQEEKSEQNNQTRQNNAGISDQQRFQQRYQQQFESQNPGAAFAQRQINFVDKLPTLHFVTVALQIGYLVSFPFGAYYNSFAMLANLFILFRKCGIPQYSSIMNYLQEIVLCEEFHNLTYMISIFMTPGGFFIHAPLIISAVLFLSLEFKKYMDKNPGTPLLNVEIVRNYVNQGASLQIQEYGRFVKADLEVYIGFYLIILIFLKGSTLMGALMYWQMMRMRYMLSVNLQLAFKRLDQNIQNYLYHPYCPGAVRTGYQFVKNYLSGLTDIQKQQQQYQQAQSSGGGIMGQLKNSCNIF